MYIETVKSRVFGAGLAYNWFSLEASHAYIYRTKEVRDLEYFRGYSF